MSGMEPWTRQLLSVIVSELCKTIGWHSISTTCLQVLVDVLDRYLKQLGRNIHNYTEIFNHTLPALEEINLAFSDMGINLENLKEYVNYVAPIPTKLKVPKYPLEKKSNLNFLKPGSREVVTRPVHIHEHLPAMYPKLSEESYPSQELQNDDSDHQNLSDLVSNSLTFKKTDDLNDNGHKKITSLTNQEPSRPLRELSCVIMTTSGFLSHAREGKMPEARLPKAVHNAIPQPPPPPPTEEKRSEHKEHKEHKKSHSKNKGKSREENHRKEDYDDGKIKKLSSKDGSKMKSHSHKPLSIKNENDSVNFLKQEKKFEQANSKESKIKIFIPEKEAPVKKEPPVVEEKLTTEPNKQKLDIFRRISKAKEDRSDSPVPKVPEDRNSISDSIESVVKGSSEREEMKFSGKTGAIQMPGMGGVLKILKVKGPDEEKLKRKKKQKFRDEEPAAKKIKLSNVGPVDPAVVVKPTEPEPPPYSFFTPHLMPEALKANLLIPRFPFMNNMAKLDPDSPHPEMPNLPLPHPMMQNSIQEKQKSPVKTMESDIVINNPLGLSDKKLKKKLKKDKREKDKKKKEKKDKIKNRERLENKKKEKLNKKEKLKKKEKLNIHKREMREDASALPKIKLILNGPNSPQPSTSGLHSPKIVIKPIVKHDEPVETVPCKEEQKSSEFAKFSALISKPSKQKNQSKIMNDSSLTAINPTVDPTIITLSKNKKSFGEIKLKKEKSKKKAEELKPRPEPFYYDSEGNQVWICPTCGGPDDGSPMIGCDGCDAWFHWVCVGIQSAPESAKWYCGLC